MKNRTPPIRFGAFEVDPASGEVRKSGVRIKLQEQPLQALLMLLERQGEVVTREELRRRLWPEGTHGDFERGINKAINRVRDALCDDADHPRYIETLPQRGYRFLIAVDMPGPSPEIASLSAETPAAGTPAVGPPADRRILRRHIPLLGGVFGAALAGYLGFRLWPPSTLPIGSIAVLPLENLTGNPAQEYFSDGITDQLITAIARISSLRVISRTSVMRYKKGNRKSLPEIAQELGVDAILEGTVLQVGAEIRITVQLIRAKDDRHLWAEAYERDVSDVLQLQAEVAEEVAGRVRAKLTLPVGAGIKRARRLDSRAYEAYLKANYFFDRPTEESLQRSIAYFTQAIQIDPAYAQAHAGLARAHNFVGIFGFRAPAEAFAEAKASALRALALDETEAEAHNALAETKKNLDWDWIGAEAGYQRALALNPSYSLARTWYAECLSRMGRHEEAIVMAERGRELDPISIVSNTALGMILYRGRKYDDAISVLQKALEFGRHPNALWFRSLSYIQKQRFREAVAGMKEAVSLSNVPVFRAALGYACALAGQRTEAVAILNDLMKQGKERYIAPHDFALVHAALGEAKSAFEWLERGYREGDQRVQGLGPEFDILRSDPRYGELTRRIRARGLQQRG